MKSYIKKVMSNSEHFVAQNKKYRKIFLKYEIKLEKEVLI